MKTQQKTKDAHIETAKEIQEFVFSRFGIKCIIAFDLRKEYIGYFSLCFGSDWNLSEDAMNTIIKWFKQDNLVKELGFCASSHHNSDNSFVRTYEGNVFTNSSKFPFPSFAELQLPSHLLLKSVTEK